MIENKNITGKILYSILFLLLLPALLWYWAKSTEGLIGYPPVHSEIPGWILAASGGILLLWGIFSLKRYGNGLPMNYAPPPKFVNQGPYRFLHHPIYWGFGILLTGISLLTGSRSGLWLVTPVTILGMIALVWGYERIDLKRRFPESAPKTILDLPENSMAVPAIKDRIVCIARILFMVIIGNYIVELVSVGVVPITGRPLYINSFFEKTYLPLLSFLGLIIVPFMFRSKQTLRQWTVAALLGLGLSLFFSMVFPTIFAQYLPDVPGSFTASSGWYPTIIIIPIFLILQSLKTIFLQSNFFMKTIAIVIAIPLILIQLTFSRSAILHLATSLVIFLIASNYFMIWKFVKGKTEIIANSWKEWVFGKVRIINHGFYIGIGTFMGILLAGFLSGKIYAWAILVFSIVVIVFSALWAQLIEGSEKLKRPFGYYGALVGIPFASLAVWEMGINVWMIIAVVSVVMPWVQATGRLRCLVNGCCHGAPVDNPDIGIRYFHYRSRVCNISGLKGKLLYPTQLYAITWLFLVGFVLLSLWDNRYPPSFIFGMYLILTGTGRFVEEAYRGEVQTKIIRGLRLYQWTAIISLLIGIGMTMIPTKLIFTKPNFSWEVLISAIIGGIFSCFAMGVDFPYSNKRFSRLV
jgi:protein-S-isoprenylcysteine O-methyltransferase Ste14